MPEGDTIHSAARRVGAALVGRPIESIETPQPRHAPDRWRRSPRRAWLVIRTPDHEVVQFDGPVLELMTEGRTRFDQRLAGLGPDILADGFSESAFLNLLREDDQTRGIGDA